MKKLLPRNSTGVSVPLGALCAKECPAIGEFPALKKFAKICKSAGLEIIQLLPVNDTGTQSSPYSGLSAFALHPIYICISALPEFSAVYKSDKNFKAEYDSFLKAHPKTARYDYQGILQKKISLLMKIYEASDVAKNAAATPELSAWMKKNPWIKNYCVYKNLKWKYMQSTWKAWKAEDQILSAEEITRRWNSKAQKKEHLFYAWVQLRAHEQFSEAAEEVRKCGIILKGDMPILMNEDSCDAWALPEFFEHSLRAGSPADGENPSGQNWGFPTYNWKALRGADYSWWKERLKSAAQYYDAYRLDHILGFFRIWAIPARECTALLGHSEPCETISREELVEAGFDEGRIRWLSEPHISTGDVDYFTWNHEVSAKILEKLATKFPNEELWLFKDSLKGDKDIFEADFEGLVSSEAENNIKQKLAEKWRSRTLIKIKKDKYAISWTYKNSAPWQTLSDEEKKKINSIVESKNALQEKKWKKQAEEILGALTSSVKMVPCGEDLGVSLKCVEEVMSAEKILRLSVVRWAREWGKEGSPFVPLSQYPELSVATTSVHDSSTIREWWNSEKESAAAFFRANKKVFAENEVGENDFADFSPNVARAILEAAAQAKSVWCIHPLQDFLYLQKKYWLENPKDERINIPGEVSEFNWTYRTLCDLEDLAKDKELLSQIKSIAKKHEVC